MDEWSGKEIWMSTVPKFAGHFKDRLYGGVTIALLCLRNWFRWGVKFLYKNSLYLLETCHEKWKLQLVNGKGLQELRLFSRHWGMPANRDTSWLKWSINGSRQWRRQHFTSDVIYIEPEMFLIFCGYLDSC